MLLSPRAVDLPDDRRHRRLEERRIHRIYGNGVVRIRRVATDVHNNT